MLPAKEHPTVAHSPGLRWLTGSEHRQAIAIFVLALLVRFAIAILHHAWVHPTRAEMEREAISLAYKGVLGNPYAVPTGPSAHVAPLYAFVLAAIFRLFGTGAAGESAKVLLTCLVTSTQCALMPWVGRALKLPFPIAFAAGIVGALLPLNPYIEVQGDFENHLSALFILLLIAWTEFLTRESPLRYSQALALGVFYGACALTTSVLIPLCLCSLAYVAFRQLRIPRGRPAAALVSLAIWILLLAPWVVRNRRELGAPIATRSNFGLEFYLANNDRASPLMTENARLFECCHPLQNVNEAKKVQRLGEVAYNRALLAQAKTWVEEHPGSFLRLTLLRVWYTWLPSAPERLREVLLRAITPLSVFGLVVIWRIRPKSGWLVAAAMIVYPLPLYLVQVHFRYRYPIGFLMLLCSCACVYELVRWSRARRRVPVRQSAA